MECYERLANAIILQAVKDFRAAYRRHLKNPYSKEYLHEVRSLEKFFFSERYRMLTELDGSTLLKKIKDTEQQKFNEKNLKGVKS